MLQRHNFLHTALKNMLVILSTLCFTSISLAQVNPWITKAPIPTSRAGLSTSVVNGKIYAVGGATDYGMPALQTVEEYDPVTDTWTTKSPMPTARTGLSTSEVNGKIYAIGGAPEWTITWGAHTALSTVEEYDPATDTWTAKSPMPTARTNLSTSVVNGKIFAIGGGEDMGNLDYDYGAVEEYDPVTDIWITKSPMQISRAFLSTSVVNDKIYAVGGGSLGFFELSQTVEEYDLVTDTWTMKTSMLSWRGAFCSSVVDGKIYAIGGINSSLSAPMDIVEEYNPITDTWTKKADMPTARSFLSTSVVNRKIYVIGGSLSEITSLSPTNVVEEYTPLLDQSLPVELISFNGYNVNGKVLLEWRTATELNNNGFEVQRKAAESEFTTIGFVKGQGTTTIQKEYSYTDRNLFDGNYCYRLKQIDYNGSYEYSNVIEVDVRLLDKFILEQNYPNPFNPTTTIGYVLQEKSNAKLTLLNSIGEEIEVLVNKEQDKGYHKVEFDATNLSSGVYFYRIQAGGYVETKKMILLR